MTATAERMKAMRIRRNRDHLREVRLLLPDARTQAVRTRVAQSIARLDKNDEADALAWIENVAEFNEVETPSL